MSFVYILFRIYHITIVCCRYLLNFLCHQVAINSIHAIDRFLFRANLETGNVSTISIPKADQNGQDYLDLTLTLNASATYQALDLQALENVAIPANGFR